jgi:putative ABC transport system substrate-binding protein
MRAIRDRLLSRRSLVSGLAAGAVLSVSRRAEAQNASKIYRVGTLWPTDANSDGYAAFLRQLRELGWTEGRNVLVNSRFAEARYERLAALAADLVRQSPDVIVALSSTGTHAIKQATTSIPVVMAAVSDPVGSGFVASLAHPGGNITGVSFNSRELNAKRLELLHQAVAAANDIAMLTNPESDRLKGAQVYEDLQAIAQRLNVRLHVIHAAHGEDLDAAFATMLRDGARAVVVTPDPMLNRQTKRIIELAAKSRLPAMYFTRESVDAGGLMSYAPNLPQLTARAAFYVDKILKGAKPADLPVEQPTTFEMVINLKTAKALGLTMPPPLLLRADQVIE